MTTTDLEKLELMLLERIKNRVGVFVPSTKSPSTKSKSPRRRKKAAAKAVSVSSLKDDNLNKLELMLLERIKKRVGVFVPSGPKKSVSTRKKKKCGPELSKNLAKKFRGIVPTKTEIETMTPAKFNTLKAKISEALDDIEKYGKQCLDGFEPAEPTLHVNPSLRPPRPPFSPAPDSDGALGEGIKPVNFVPVAWEPLIAGIADDVITDEEFARQSAIIRARSIARGANPRLFKTPTTGPAAAPAPAPAPAPARPDIPLPVARKKKKRIAPTLVS